MKKVLRVTTLIVLGLMASPLSVLATPPLETMQTSVNRVLEVLRDPALKGESAKGRKEKQVWAIMDGVFDYDELSKRTLAQHWKAFNSEQQKEFTQLFGKLLGGIYMDKIMGYTNEKVVFTKASTFSDEMAEVQSEIITATKSIPIGYRMISKGGQWKVYDVMIEGVSLVQNYRSQFRDILSKKSAESLLNMLREKVKK